MTVFLDPGVALLLAAAFTGALCSGVAGAWLVGRLDHGRRPRDVRRTNVDRAIDAVVALRDAYRRGAGGVAVDRGTVSALEEALACAAAHTAPPVVAAARDYVRAGRVFAAGDPDTAVAREQAAFTTLTAALLAERQSLARGRAWRARGSGRSLDRCSGRSATPSTTVSRAAPR